MVIELLTNKYPGMRLWLSQRLSALIMAVYIVLLVLLLAIFQPANYSDWYTLVSPVWFRLLTFLFFVSLFIHAWLGVSDVFKDYIFNKQLRAYLQIIVDILLVVYLIWASFILWNI
jgi:succinate dehydrogenase / fumarate reductase, membrane anchor subunit